MTAGAATLAARKRNLEQQLSYVARVPVEITVRGDTSFTWSLQDVNHAAADRLVAFAKEQPAGVCVEVAHDDECGTCIYVDFKA